jgi:hypothetical protein
MTPTFPWPGAKNLVKQEGLPVLRRIAKETEVHARIQGALAQILDVFTASGAGLSAQESHKWSPILLRWVCSQNSESVTRDCGCRILMRVVNSLDQGGIPISQAWLAMLLMDVVSDRNVVKTRNQKARSMVQVSLYTYSVVRYIYFSSLEAIVRMFQNYGCKIHQFLPVQVG